jgi:outer membrane protein assembly factor BamB
VIRDGGILTTINPETGEQLRQDRLKDAIGQYYASPVAGDGKIYFVSLDGKVSVVWAGADWEKTSSGDLEERVVATPAIAGSRINVRTESALYCFAAPQQGK